MWKKFEDKLIKWAGVISQNTVLVVISRSFMMIFPFMMIGSIFTLITGFPSDSWVAFLNESGLMSILSIPMQYTTEFISVYLAFAVGYTYCTKKGVKKNAVVTGLISVFAFLILVPYAKTGEGWEAVTAVPFTNLGAKGMFIALIEGFLVGYIVTFIIKKKWTIRMPESVPPFVTNSFSALIPAFVITFLFILIRYAFTFTPWADVITAFYALLQKPLSIITSGPWGVAIIETISMTLWWLGIHGGAVTYSMKNVLFAEARLGNMAAYAAGNELPFIVTGLFLTVGVIPLVVDCLLIARSRRMKSVAKVALVPAIFGISEPINFGLPVVLNPILAIPTIIIYPLSVFATYMLNLIGWLPFCNGTQIRNCPYFILSFVQFGGFRGLFWWIVLFIISCLIYWPFVKIVDKKYHEEEQTAQAISESVHP